MLYTSLFRDEGLTTISMINQVVLSLLQMMVRFHFSHEIASCSVFLQDHLEILNSGCDAISIGLAKFKENCGKVGGRIG